jgi:hypothetical protein
MLSKEKVRESALDNKEKKNLTREQIGKEILKRAW